MNTHGSNGHAPHSAQTTDPEFVQGLERGFAVIKAFSADAPSLTIAEVAARTKLTRAVARRYLLTLQKLGYLVHDGSEFSPTPRLLDLGYTYLATMSVADVAQPFIERITDRLHESSSMAVLDGQECVYIARVQGRKIITTTLVVGSRVPAHATAMGKVLLANLSPSDLDEYFRTAALKRFTKWTLADEARLRKALREIREQGWALADQEFVVGLRTIAAPVFDRTNRVKAAINIAGAVAVVSMKEMLRVHLPVLLEATHDISRALGANVEKVSVSRRRFKVSRSPRPRAR
jgi:IclR family pca regulon transcriptional regulator